MNISSITNITDLSQLGTGTVTKTTENRNASFESMFQAAVNMIEQTNDYTNAAEEAETAYALGLTDSTHDLQIAQQKANLSLQYTVAVRNAVMDAYKEIMNLQF
jgi:flagellar hook-basal body complex protein FliE